MNKKKQILQMQSKINSISGSILLVKSPISAIQIIHHGIDWLKKHTHINNYFSDELIKIAKEIA